MLMHLYDLLFNPSVKIKKIYSKSVFLAKLPKPFSYLREIPKFKIIKKFSCYISPKSIIDKTVYFPHPTGIVIGDGVRIGKNVTIYQHVTLGAARRGEGRLNAYPIVEDNVIIYAGAKIIGSIKIGSGSVIGANAVVTKDIPPNSVAVGIPAKVKE